MTEIKKITLPLPEIPIADGRHCGQTKINQVLDFLYTNNPALIEELYPKWLDSLYSLWFHLHDVKDYLRSEACKPLDLSPSRLEMMDIIFELYCRFLHALGEEVPKLKGNPISNSPSGPFTPLVIPAVDIPNVTQESVDTLCRFFYEQKPEIFYEIAEAQRRDMPLFETSAELRKGINEHGDKSELPNTELSRIYSLVERAAAATCGIERRKK